MNKEIYFCVDSQSFANPNFKLGAICCDTYEKTEQYIRSGLNDIATTSMAHFSFDLLSNYDIYLCYKDKKVKIEKGMPLPCGLTVECWNSSNVDCALLLTFMQGKFDELLGIKCERF